MNDQPAYTTQDMNAWEWEAFSELRDLMRSNDRDAVDRAAALFMQFLRDGVIDVLTNMPPAQPAAERGGGEDVCST